MVLDPFCRWRRGDDASSPPLPGDRVGHRVPLREEPETESLRPHPDCPPRPQRGPRAGVVWEAEVHAVARVEGVGGSCFWCERGGRVCAGGWGDKHNVGDYPGMNIYRLHPDAETEAKTDTLTDTQTHTRIDTLPQIYILHIYDL